MPYRLAAGFRIVKNRLAALGQRPVSGQSRVNPVAGSVKNLDKPEIRQRLPAAYRLTGEQTNRITVEPMKL
jgi:hypothetical protein